MHAHQEPRDRPSPSPAPPRPTEVPRILGLQHTVGNAAVAAMVQRMHDGAGSSVAGVLRSSGRPLDQPLRAEMEARLGADFSDVRLHTDAVAKRSAAQIGARAYTSGSHVVVGDGGADKHTLAHELTHVLQQREGPVPGTDHGNGLSLSDPSDRFERAAEENATRVMRSAAPAPDRPATTQRATGARSASIQRVVESADQQAETARRSVLVVSDVSGMGLGGVPVFNMELVKGLVASGHHVTMLTVDPANYDADTKAQQHGGANIVNIPTPEGVEPRDSFDELIKRRPNEFDLPPGQDAFDVIIGHSRFSGPGAQKIRDTWYSSARLVHFLHTSPVRLDKIKGDPGKGAKKASAERKAVHHADLVAGVGPLLTKEAERLSQQILRVPALHQFVPGTEIEPIAENRPGQTPGAPTRLRLLLPGRATDEIKGVEAAIKAIGMLRGLGVKVHLTVRGGPDRDKNPQEYVHWQRLADEHGRNGVTLLPFTTSAEELTADRGQADALIMPSLHEGFGLVATEAAGRGIPVRVNGESGAAQFLQQFTELGVPNPMVVDAPFQTDPATGREIEGGAHQRAAAWATAIKKLAKGLATSREDAAQLHALLERYTWQHAAEALIAAAMATTHAVTNPRTGLSHGYGAITRQGPDGTVIPDDTVTPGSTARSDWEPRARWDGSTPTPPTDTLWAPSSPEERIQRIQQLWELGVL